MERWEMEPAEVPAFLHGYQLLHGPSQADLGRAVGMEQSTVSNFLNGRWATWRALTAVRLATGLGLKMRIVIERRHN